MCNESAEDSFDEMLKSPFHWRRNVKDSTRIGDTCRHPLVSSSHEARVWLSVEVAKSFRCSLEHKVEKRSLAGHRSGPAASAERPPPEGKQWPSRVGRASDINESLVVTTCHHHGSAVEQSGD